MHFYPKKIVNLTLHQPSREMRKLGVFELSTNERFRLKQLLDIEPDNPPKPEEIRGTAKEISELAELSGVSKAIISGPSYLMSSLENELRKKGISPLYVHGEPKRYSVDTELDGLPEVRCGYRIDGFIEPPDHWSKNA